MDHQKVPVWLEGVRGDQVVPLIVRDDRYIRVAAGPGTGKTFGLTKRVLRIVHPEGLAVPGSKVLVVAFNRIIAKELSEAIEEGLGDELKERRPTIKTVHRLCLEIMDGNTRILMDHERDAMLYDVMHLVPQLKEKYKNFKGLSQALHDHEAGHKPDDLLGASVRHWLDRHKAQLVGDLPQDLLDSLKLGGYPEQRFDHIIADEFQDLTAAEQQMLLRLLDEGGHFVALGDPRQSIYHFRGNDPNGLASLEHLTGAKVSDVQMTGCQRCPARIVNAANRLTVASTASPMTVDNERLDNTHVVTWKSPENEIRGMAKAIYENYQADPTGDHLVMVTRRKYGYELRDELLRLWPDMCIDLSFSEQLLETWAAREAFLFFCLLNAPDAPTWRAWLGYRTSSTADNFLSANRNSPAYLKLLAESEDRITEEFLFRFALAPVSQGSGQGVNAIRKRIGRYETLKRKLSALKSDPPKFVAAVFSPEFWEVAEMTDSETATNDLGLLKELALAQMEEVRLSEADESVLLSKVAVRVRNRIATRDATTQTDKNALKISTLWSAKGVTANHVYALGLCDEAIPGGRADSYPGTESEFIEEQRRLFYVSLTRSKETLVLSYPQTIGMVEAKRMRFDLPSRTQSVVKLHPSRFLKQIARDMPDAATGENWRGCLPV